MDAHEIESAIECAINALGLAKIALQKSALPAFSERDDLRKAFLGDNPRASQGDAMKRASDAVADLKSRLDSLEARDAPAYTITRGAQS
jgi:hypothetical protein